jgi:hypothetical protein
LYTLSLSMFYPLGALVQSAFARTWGVRPVTVTAAGLLAVVLVMVTIFHPEFWDEMARSPNEPVTLLAE